MWRGVGRGGRRESVGEVGEGGCNVGGKLREERGAVPAGFSSQ